MLYIKFNIEDVSTYQDFQKLYDHLVSIRQPGFEFNDEGPEFDWDSMTVQEVEEATKQLIDFLDEKPEVRRYQKLIPAYAHTFLERYLDVDNETLQSPEMQEVLSIFNYLEYGFEVDLDHLKKTEEHSGIIEFSTGNYPFGGMERFLITLKAFGLLPTECFNGFTICTFKWVSDFEYDTIEFPDKTKDYLKKYRN